MKREITNIKRLTISAVVAVMTALIFIGSVPVWAATTWNVPGDGSNTCTTVNPSCNKIQDAINAATNGDTIDVAAGTYDESVDVNKSIILKGEPGAVVRPDNSTPLLDQGVRRVGVYVEDGVDNVTIEGFEVDGTGGTVHYGIYAFNSNNTTVKDNTVHDIKNEIANPVSDVAGAGILFFGWGQGIDGATVEGNTVYNTGRHGIFIGGMQSETPYDWLLSNNDAIGRNNVHHTWQGPTNDFGAGIQMNGEKDCVIDGNNVHHTGQPTDGDFYPGIYLAGTVGGTVSRNNVHQNLYGLVI
jgi:nitrous oxidase accessory protein NosD